VTDRSGDTDRPRWIAVGRITGAHGVKGEVAVLPLSQVSERFEPGSRLFLGQSESNPLVVSSSRPHRQRLLVAFEAVDGRTQAEGLQGEYLFVPASAAPPLPGGEFWAHDLVGCRVESEEGRPLGRIKEVIHTPANDVWAAEGEYGEILIPALKDVVADVDLQERRVLIREIPGLTAP
jgi:16S rRNA processing protein RimM